MTIRVSTREYEFSHGKQPKGRGHWAFQIGERVGFIDGTYTEAKKLAGKQAKQEGVEIIEVLP